MALIDNTIAGVSSNSYISLSESTGYANESYLCSDWLTATSGVQEQCLIEACSLMESHRFRYSKSTSTQNLFFPRGVDLQTDGSYLIPEAIKKAQFLIAFNIYKTKTLMLETDKLRGAGIVSYSLGDYSISLKEGDGSFSFFNSTIRRLFYPFVNWSGTRKYTYTDFGV